MSTSSDKLITSTKLIDKAEIVQTGWGNKSIRMKHEGKEIGFATTTYSHHQTDQIKAYSAERVTLLMMLAQGMTNDEIKQLVAKRR